ncbi:MAG: hypothetical protein IPL53_19380 [Ignavibacteria bacterium]|nr:hypothetical protein [Ignavibacteria bacterium]
MKIKLIIYSCLLVSIIFLTAKSSYSQDTITSKNSTFIVTGESMKITDLQEGEERTVLRNGCKTIRRYNDGTEENPKDWHIALYYEDAQSGNVIAEDVMFSEGDKDACEKVYNSLMRLWEK